MKSLLFAGLLMFASGIALAQEQQIDPRLAAPLVSTLQAEVQLRDAMLKALQEDAAKREKDWAEYSKQLWQSPEK